MGNGNFRKHDQVGGILAEIVDARLWIRTSAAVDGLFEPATRSTGRSSETALP